MNDWRANLDKLYEQRTNDNAKNRHRQQEKEIEKKLETLQKKFNCHICGKLPTGPSSTYTSKGSMSDWSRPNNLNQCDSCGRWVCERHSHKPLGSYQYFCQTCGEKSTPPHVGAWRTKVVVSGFITGMIIPSLVLIIINSISMFGIAIIIAWIGLLVIRKKNYSQFLKEDYFWESFFKGMFASPILSILIFSIMASFR